MPVALPPVAFDTETWLIQPGRLAPPLVCLSWYDHTDSGALLDRPDGVAWLKAHLAARDALIVGHNVSYDFGVCVQASKDPLLLAMVFAAYEGCRVGDTLVFEKLRKIAKGWHEFDARTGRPPLYTLAALSDEYLSERIEGKAGEDAWRFRYHELDGVPLDQWPQEAADYAREDARYTLRVWQRQQVTAVQDQDPQYRADWALHLMGAWGMRTDPAAVDALDVQLHEHVDAQVQYLETVGLYKWTGTQREPRRALSKNTAAIRERVEAAYKRKAEIASGPAITVYVPLATEHERGQPAPWSTSSDYIVRTVTDPRDPEKQIAVWCDDGGAPLQMYGPDAGDREYLEVPRGGPGPGPFAPLTPGGLEAQQTGQLWVLGHVSTAAEVLADSGDSDLEILAEIAGDQKLISTYLPILKQGTELAINARYNVLVATGRTSCSKPNMQNQPRKGGVRECFVPREGYLFAACDYTGAELAGMAQILVDKFGLQSSQMAQVLISGKSILLVLAAEIIGITYEEAVTRYEAKDPLLKDMRQLAKAPAYGFMGGMGPSLFAVVSKQQYGIIMCGKSSTPGPDHDKRFDENGVCAACVEVSTEFRNMWFGLFPEMKPFFKEISINVARGGGQFDLEHHRSRRIRGGVHYTDGSNSYFQGLVADGAKAALYSVVRECYLGVPYKTNLDDLLDQGWDGTPESAQACGVALSPLYGCRAVAFIHDEIILEVPADLPVARAAVTRMSEIMVAEMRVFCPDIPIAADGHLMDRWWKGAEPVFNADGELIVWQPKEKVA